MINPQDPPTHWDLANIDIGLCHPIISIRFHEITYPISGHIAKFIVKLQLSASKYDLNLCIVLLHLINTGSLEYRIHPIAFAAAPTPPSCLHIIRSVGAILTLSFISIIFRLLLLNAAGPPEPLATHNQPYAARNSYLLHNGTKFLSSSSTELLGMLSFLACSVLLLSEPVSQLLPHPILRANAQTIPS